MGDDDGEDEDMDDDEDEDVDSSSSDTSASGEFPRRESQYYYDPTGNTMRCTGGQFTYGINPSAGAVYFLALTSPLTAARKLWEEEPEIDQLPTLRASSDFAWGAWNKVMDANSVGVIKKIFNMYITNEATKAVIAEAAKREGGGPVRAWPGVDFDASEGGLALLGRAFPFPFPLSIFSFLFLPQDRALDFSCFLVASICSGSGELT